MDIKEFLPELRTMIQGPLHNLMADELFSSAIVFCKESQIVRETIELGEVAANSVIPITSTDADLSVWGTAKVYNSNGKLELSRDYFQNERDKIVFNESLSGVFVVVWLIPKTKGVIPDALMPHKSGVCYGAAAKLYSQPNRPWSNGGQSDYYMRMYTEEYRAAWRDQLDQFGTFNNPQPKNSYWM